MNEILYEVLMKRMLLTFAVCTFGIALFVHTQAYARTIALVFDDSRSMWGSNKYVYANYAAQTLLTLLENDDELNVVLMSSPEQYTEVPVGRSRQSFINETIKRDWTPQGQTPYQAVSTAMDALRKSRIETTLLRRQEQNWLIITTDGDFNDYNPQSKAEIMEFIAATKGKVRVAFILISPGDKTNPMWEVPRDWQEIAPGQVNIHAVSPDDLTQKIREIAASITGRDDKEVPARTQGNTIEFSSYFPVRRVTVFEQAKERQPVTLERVVSKEHGTLQDMSIESYTISSIQGDNPLQPQGTFSGKVSHCIGSSVMPSGEYTLRFDQDVQNRNIQVLVEAAVDFKVNLYNEQDRQIPSRDNRYRVCAHEEIEIAVQFYAQGTNDILPISDAAREKLTIVPFLNGQKKDIDFHFDETKQMFRSKALNVTPGEQSLSIETSCPGYFHLKSNILTITGQKCRRDVSLIPSKDTVKVPYVYSQSMKQVDETVNLRLQTQERTARIQSGKYELSSAGIPPGIALDVQGRELTRSNPAVTLTGLKPGKPVQVQVLRDKSYREEAPTDIELEITSKNQLVKSSTCSITLLPVSRDITLTPLQDDWSASLNGLDQTEPLTLELRADGRLVNTDEYKNWSFKVQGPPQLNLDINPIQTASSIDLNLRPSGRIEPGKKTIQVTARGPFPHDYQRTTVKLDIQNAPLSFKSSKQDVQVPYVFSKRFQPVDTPLSLELLQIQQTGTFQPGSFELMAEGIPPGILLRIQGKELTRSKPTLTLTGLKPGTSIPVQILRDKTFVEEAPALVKLEMSSNNPLIMWKTSNSSFSLIPKPRAITLKPLQEKWSAVVTDLDEAEPLAVELRIDAELVRQDEYKHWTFEKKEPSRFNLDLIRYSETSSIALQPLYVFCSSCLTATGAKEVELTAQGPFPLEKKTITATFHILDAPWWKKCLTLIVLIASLIIFFWWLIGIYKKPRFASGSLITFQSTLSSGKQRNPHSMKLAGNWFFRWLVPYIPEKKRIGNFTFTAHKQPNTIAISKDQERAEVWVDGTLQDRPWRTDIRIRPNTILEERTNGRINEYKYQGRRR